MLAILLIAILLTRPGLRCLTTLALWPTDTCQPALPGQHYSMLANILIGPGFRCLTTLALWPADTCQHC